MILEGRCVFIVKGRRYRYILFSYLLSSPKLGFVDVNNLFKSTFRKNVELSFPNRVRLIHFKDNLGICRCAHLDQENVCEMINALQVNQKKRKICFQTSGCSGTLHALYMKYHVEKPKRKRKVKNNP